MGVVPDSMKQWPGALSSKATALASTVVGMKERRGQGFFPGDCPWGLLDAGFMPRLRHRSFSRTVEPSAGYRDRCTGPLIPETDHATAGRSCLLRGLCELAQQSQEPISANLFENLLVDRLGLDAALDGPDLWLRQHEGPRMRQH